MSQVAKSCRFVCACTVIALVLASIQALAGPPASGVTRAAKGILEVSFLYMPPVGEVHPTYHTAIWLENESGKLVKTLYVSQELSVTEYKIGEACADWISQAQWEKADKSLVDAVTAPTPNVGSGSMTFDLSESGIAPGTYRFCFEVHFYDNYNILYRGPILLDQSASQAELEVYYLPSQPVGATDVIRYVQARYIPDPANPQE